MDSLKQLVATLPGSNDKSFIYKQLHKIRSMPDFLQFFTENLLEIGTLCEILAQKTNEKILEVTLSLLGNCCSKEVCCEKAIFFGVVTTLISILSSINAPSVLFRACRLLGNLSQFPKCQSFLVSTNASYVLDGLLRDTNQSINVHTMTIRAVRQLWTQKKFRTEMMSLGVIRTIMSILKKCLKKCHVEDLTEEEVVEKDSVILRRENAPDRLISKERLSRLLKDTNEHFNYQILPVKPKTLPAVEFTIPQSREDLDLITGCFKCLKWITLSISSEIADQICVEGVACLTFLAEENRSLRGSALQILYNLSACANAHEELSNVVKCLAGLMIDSKELEIESQEQMHCIVILSRLSRHVRVRIELKDSGVLKTLLEIAQTTQIQKEVVLVLVIVQNYRYDPKGIEQLLSDGLICVLIKILEDIVREKEVQHISKKEAENYESPKANKSKRTRSSSLTGNTPKLCKYEFSDPESPNSSGYGGSTSYQHNYQYSPSHSSYNYSPYSSPARSYQDAEEDFDDAYSPVCSDNEEAEPGDIISSIVIAMNDSTKLNNIEDFAEDSNSCSSVVSELNSHQPAEPTEPSPKENDQEDELKVYARDPLTFVLNLMWTVIIQNNFATHYTRSSTLDILLKVCYLVPHPEGRICKILGHILSHFKNFVAILKQNFVSKLHQLKHPKYEHEDCYSCSKMISVGYEFLRLFGQVGEGGYGRGEIAHFLLIGDDHLQKQVAINLTFIISSPETLYTLLFECKALDIVLSVIFDRQELSCEAANGLTTLAVNLNIKLPFEIDLDKVDKYLKVTSSAKKLGSQVTFKVMDESVQFDKEMLTRSSDVFLSMFTSNFLEGEKNEVHLPECSTEGLKYFLHLIELSEENKLNETAPLVENMEVVLDAYQLCSKYILSSMRSPLLNAIKLTMRHHNALQVFEFSLKYVDRELLESSICYYLNADIAGSDKADMFYAANQSEFSAEWRRLIIDTILLKCQPHLE